MTEVLTIRIVVPFLFGICVGWVLKDFITPYWWAFGVAVIVCACIITVSCRHRFSYGSRFFGIIVYLFFFFLGACLLLHEYKSSVVSWPSNSTVYKGVVTDVPQNHGRVTYYTVRLLGEESNKRWMPRNETVRLSILMDSVGQGKYKIGDGLLFYCKLETPRNAGNPNEFDYASWLRRQNVTGTAFLCNCVKKVSADLETKMYEELPIFQRLRICALQFRGRLSICFNELKVSSQQRAVLEALTLGDKYQLSRDTRLLFSETGASHVLALSGLHLGILISFLMVLMVPLMHRKFGRYIATVTGLLLIWSFALLTGLNVSLLRAAIMYSVFLLFLMNGRSSSTINSLGLAAFLLLLWNPMSLFDISFQLSFLSVFSILFFQPVYNRFCPKRHWKKILTGLIYVALAAQIVTAPIVAYSFHLFSLCFLLSNIVVIPCAYILLGGAFCFFIFYPIGLLRILIGMILCYTVQGMLLGLNCIAGLPFSSIIVYPSFCTMLIIYVVLYLLVCTLYEHSKRYLIFFMISVFVLSCSIAYSHRSDRVPSEIIFYNIPPCPAIHFISSAEHSYLWTMFPNVVGTKMAYVKRTFWDAKTITQPAFFFNEYRNGLLKCQQNIVEFMGKRIAIISDDRWRNKIVSKPINVDILYLCKGCHTSLCKLSKFFNPRLVVLDGSFREYACLHYAQECQLLGFKYYDVIKRGALIILIKKNIE